MTSQIKNLFVESQRELLKLLNPITEKMSVRKLRHFLNVTLEVFILLLSGNVQNNDSNLSRNSYNTRRGQRVPPSSFFRHYETFFRKFSNDFKRSPSIFLMFRDRYVKISEKFPAFRAPGVRERALARQFSPTFGFFWVL